MRCSGSCDMPISKHCQTQSDNQSQSNTERAACNTDVNHIAMAIVLPMPGSCTEKSVLPCCFLSRHAFCAGALSSSCSCSSTAHPNVAPAPIRYMVPNRQESHNSNHNIVCHDMGQQPNILSQGEGSREQTDIQTDIYICICHKCCPRPGIRVQGDDLACCQWTQVAGYSCLTAHMPLHESLDAAKFQTTI